MRSIRVYVTCWWDSDQNMFEAIKKYGFGRSVWKNIEFTLDNNYDRIIILRGLNKDSKYPYDPQKAITFFTEPSDSKESLKHESRVVHSFLPLPWWNSLKKESKKYILQAEEIKKEKLLSSVTSSYFKLPGHQKRVEFLLKLDGIIEEGLDIFGRDKSGEFKKLVNSHRGGLEDKYDGLWPYKYHFACENSFLLDYFTEKIVDPIIAECLCFYDGCLNVADYIDERAFIKIDVHNPKTSIYTMIDAIEDDQWGKRIKYIRQQKQRFLYDLNPLNIIWMAVNDMDVERGMKL